ncbi:MAG: DUF2752 domain-containing protein [Hominenteromicrobium sp.]
MGIICFSLFLLAGALLLLHPPCLIRRVFGVLCPACGTTRMLEASLRLDFPAAFRLNPYMFFALPAAGIWSVLEAIRYIGGRPALLMKRWAIVFWLSVLGIGLVFAVCRNLA